MLTPEEVESATQVLLLHGAGSDSDIQSWISQFPDMLSLQRAFINSTEFKLTQNRRNIADFLARDLSSTDLYNEIQAKFSPESVVHGEGSGGLTVEFLAAVSVISAHLKPRVIVVLGSREQEEIARHMAKAFPNEPISIISNCIENYPGADENANFVSRPVIRLPMGANVLLDTLLHWKIAPNVVISGAQSDPEVMKTAFAYGSKRTAILYAAQERDDPSVQLLSKFVPPHMGDILELGNYLLISNLEFPAPVEYRPVTGASLVKSEIKIGLATIVRDEEELLPGMLRSCAGVIDYAVVVDTGSNDSTCAVAQKVLDEMGIQYAIHHREFVDFASARNEAIALMPQYIDWTLMLDADEYLVEADKQKLIDLANDAEADAWNLPRYNFTSPELVGAVYAYSDRQARLFRTGAGHSPQYVNAVHEALVGFKHMKSAPGNASSIGGSVGGPHIHHMGMFKSQRKTEIRAAQNYKLAAEHGLVA